MGVYNSSMLVFMYYLPRDPVSFPAEVEDVVNAIVFLLSDQSAMINCATLPVDGGFLAC